MKDIQNKNKNGDIIFIISDYPEEFKTLERENHTVLIYTKEQLNYVIAALTENEDYNSVKKTLFLDDSTSLTKLTYSADLLLMLT